MGPSLELVQGVYEKTQNFPQSETFGLTGQMRRAAISIPSNIAEGHARDTTREFLHSVSIALGSLAELKPQFELAARLRYWDSDCAATLLCDADRIGKMLRGVQKSLRDKL